MANEVEEKTPVPAPAQVEPVSECPACGVKIAHPLGTLDSKEEVVECMSCGTAWIPSRASVPAKDPLSIGGTDNLSRDMAKFATPYTVAAARRLRSFDHLVSDGAFSKQRVLFSVGGLILAANKIPKLVLVDSNAQSATFTKEK